jgi:hypothetical protein
LFRFNKRSDDGSGKGNLVATGSQADLVWGVVFEIVDAERESAWINPKAATIQSQ